MTLSELLTSYNLVKSPETVDTIDVTPSDKYTRMLQYVDSKKSSTPENPITEDVDYSWQGWSYSGDATASTPTNKPTNSQTPANKHAKSTVTYTTIPRTNTIRAIQTANKDAYNKFVRDFDKYLQLNLLYAGDKDVLTSIAALESGYKPSISNKHSGALGYFLFLDSTRTAYNKSTREQFANDTNQLFDAAVQHYNAIKKLLSKYQNEIKNSGLTDLLVAYGMWWRPGSMLNYLKTGKDGYVNKSDGMTLEKILQRAN